jgi:hypothetical protein
VLHHEPGAATVERERPRERESKECHSRVRHRLASPRTAGKKAVAAASKPSEKRARKVGAAVGDSRLGCRSGQGDPLGGKRGAHEGCVGHLRLGECLAATGISHRSHILTAGPPFVVGGSLRSWITGMAHPVEFALLSSLFCSVSLRIYSRGR